MTRLVMNLLLVAFVALPVTATPAPKPTKAEQIKRELGRLAGTWIVTYVENDGVVQPQQVVDVTPGLIFKGDEELTFTNGTKGKIAEIDPTTSPKQIHYETETGVEEYKTQFGIYKLEGDVFIDCVSLGGKERPKDFTAKKGSGHILMKYKRSKE